jgi:sn-glycerol 3-phosphate transport system permease protein
MRRGTVTSARQRRREAALGYLLVSPPLVVFGVFVFYPLARNVQLALYRNPPFPHLPKRYVGTDQIVDVLTSSDFRSSLVATGLFALVSVPAGMLLGLQLAVAAHRRIRGIGVYRTIFASTVTSSVAVAAVIFGTLFNPVVGWLPAVGLRPDPAVLDNPRWALVGVAIVTIWQNVGLSFVVMSAGLQAVPEELWEAADIDGAGPWRRLWSVTVPLLSPTIFFSLVVGSIFALQSYGQFDLLTPEGAERLHTNVLTFEIVTALRERQDPGVAAVLTLALFALTLVLTLLQLRLLERRVHYAR